MSTMFKLLFLQLACVSIVLVNADYRSDQTISVVTRTLTLPAGYIYYPNVRAAYKIHSNKVDWSDAKRTCVSEGGRLAVVDTQEKLGIIKAQRPEKKALWVGVTKKRSTWVTVDTETQLVQLPWGSGQPEGIGDCATIQKDGKGLYNRLCVWDQRFVCEIPVETTVYQVPCNCH